MILPGRGDAPVGFQNQLVITDADCGFCQNSIQFCARHFKGTWINVPNNTVDSSQFGLSDHQITTASWWVESVDGRIRVFGGAKNFGAMMINAGTWRVPIGVLAFIPPFSWIAAGLYRFIAANRGRFPGSTPSCSV